MKKWLESYAAILKSVGAFALCFVMLFVMTGALAEEPLAGNADRTQDIAEVGTVTYDFEPEPVDNQLGQGA